MSRGFALYINPRKYRGATGMIGRKPSPKFLFSLGITKYVIYIE